MDNKIVLVILAILLPPLAVFLKKGTGQEFVISIILTLCGYLPGQIFALWSVLK